VLGHLGKAAARRLVRERPEDSAALGEALLAELDALKGMAMKVGQILSFMDVGLPEETVQRLARLQQGVSPLSVEAIRAELEACLGAPVEALFERFDAVPVASASIGQVHRGRVTGWGEVAIKVRYPGVRETVEADFGQLRRLGRLASLGTEVDGPALVAELQARMVEECDYAHEARMQALFAGLFSGDEEIEVPEVVASRSGASVLTTVWKEGERFEALRGASSSRRGAVARTLVRFPFTSLFGHGVLHGDPHPGNVLFPGEGRVVVLDFGCVRWFEAAEVEGYRRVAQAVLEGREVQFCEAVVEAGLAPRPEAVDFGALWAMYRWSFAPYLSRRFRFDEAWWRQGRAYSGPSNANLRHLAMPPAWIWLQRIQFGLHAVLVRLGVEGELRDVFRGTLELPLSRGGVYPLLSCDHAAPVH